MWKRWISLVLLAFALTGAPFGMGRMMDTAHAAHASQHMSGHHGHDMPIHKADAPHYVACAACAAATADAAAEIQLMVLQGTHEVETQASIADIFSAPPTPPPRA